MTKHAKPEAPPTGTQDKPKSDTPSGRIAFDDRGNAVWKWRSNMDTQEVKALRDSAEDSLSIAETQKHKIAEGRDPYSSASPPPRSFSNRSPAPGAAPAPEKKPQRRTLDDMRRLSEEIKRQRALKKPD